MAADISVEVQGDDIVVTLPGTSYVVTYYRAAAAFPQQLITKSHSGREDEGAPMTQAEFHARAWIAANAKARELGWIVYNSASSEQGDPRQMVNVNYRAEAGLYHRVFGGFKISGPLGYKRFRTAAGAIRFAIEQLPEKFLLGASLEVGDERYNEKEIRQLYDSEAYPLKRHGKRLSLQKAPSKISRG